MSALAISVIVFLVVLGGSWLGAFLGRVLPEHHFSDQSKDMIKVGIGFLATLAALVLGLLIATWVKGELAAERSGTGAQPIIEIEEFQHLMRTLAPTNDVQSLLKTRLVQLSDDIAQTRWLLVEQTGSSIPVPFLVVLVLWLAAISGCLSLFAPRNGTVLAVNVVCALSFASAIFLILELDTPFEGLLRISDAPLRNALAYVNR